MNYTTNTVQVVALINEATRKNDKDLLAGNTRGMQVFVRAGYRCEYVGSSNFRCTARTHLEIDHQLVFSLGGSNELENLALLCSAHNKRKGELEFGGPQSMRYRREAS